MIKPTVKLKLELETTNEVDGKIGVICIIDGELLVTVQIMDIWGLEQIDSDVLSLNLMEVSSCSWSIPILAAATRPKFIDRFVSENRMLLLKA